MKKQSVSNMSKHVCTAAIVTLGLVLPAQAATGKDSLPKDTAAIRTQDDKVQVKYMGSTEDGVIFQVLYQNTNGKSFTVKVLDDAGDVLYEDDFTDTSFRKKFLLPKAYTRLKFTITGSADKVEQSFAVNIQTRLIEDVVVSRN
jgi:hypothetical protein